MDGKAKILFVDDDPEILATLKRTFRRKYLVETALGPLRGLEAATEHGPYAVVVADLRMPGLDGLEFFTQLKKLSPADVADETLAGEKITAKLTNNAPL